MQYDQLYTNVYRVCLHQRRRQKGGWLAAESPDRHDAVDGLPITGRRAELSRWLDAAVTGPGQAKVVVERPGHQNNRPGM